MCKYLLVYSIEKLTQNDVISNRIYLIIIKTDLARLSLIKQNGALSCLAKSRLERYYEDYSVLSGLCYIRSRLGSSIKFDEVEMYTRVVMS